MLPPFEQCPLGPADVICVTLGCRLRVGHGFVPIDVLPVQRELNREAAWDQRERLLSGGATREWAKADKPLGN